MTRSVTEGLENPTALGIGAFAVTFTTSSLNFGWLEKRVCRYACIGNVLLVNFLICDYTRTVNNQFRLTVTGIGTVISARWELVRGDTYAYTSSGAFCLL